MVASAARVTVPACASRQVVARSDVSGVVPGACPTPSRRGTSLGVSAIPASSTWARPPALPPPRLRQRGQPVPLRAVLDGLEEDATTGADRVTVALGEVAQLAQCVSAPAAALGMTTPAQRPSARGSSTASRAHAQRRGHIRQIALASASAVATHLSGFLMHSPMGSPSSATAFMVLAPCGRALRCCAVRWEGVYSKNRSDATVTEGSELWRAHCNAAVSPMGVDADFFDGTPTSANGVARERARISSLAATRRRPGPSCSVDTVPTVTKSQHYGPAASGKLFKAIAVQCQPQRSSVLHTSRPSARYCSR